MRALNPTLLSANREMKSILSRTAFGISLEKLRADNDRISKLNDDEFTELMEYITSSGTVVFFERDNLVCIIHSSKYQEGMGEVLPLYEVEESRTSNTKSKVVVNSVSIHERCLERLEIPSVPLLHFNRETPVAIDLEPLVPTLLELPHGLRALAAELMGYARDVYCGLTESELCRRSSTFDLMTPEERKWVLDAIDDVSDLYAMVDEGVPTRSRGVRVLLHKQFWTSAHIEASPTELHVESPFASLAALKGKLPLEPVKKELPELPAEQPEPPVENSKLVAALSRAAAAKKALDAAQVEYDAAIADMLALAGKE